MDPLRRSIRKLQAALYRISGMRATKAHGRGDETPIVGEAYFCILEGLAIQEDDGRSSFGAHDLEGAALSCRRDEFECEFAHTPRGVRGLRGKTDDAAHDRIE